MDLTSKTNIRMLRDPNGTTKEVDILYFNNIHHFGNPDMHLTPFNNKNESKQSRVERPGQNRFEKPIRSTFVRLLHMKGPSPDTIIINSQAHCCHRMLSRFDLMHFHWLDIHRFSNMVHHAILHVAIRSEDDRKYDTMTNGQRASYDNISITCSRYARYIS